MLRLLLGLTLHSLQALGMRRPTNEKIRNFIGLDSYGTHKVVNELRIAVRLRDLCANAFRLSAI